MSTMRPKPHSASQHRTCPKVLMSFGVVLLLGGVGVVAWAVVAKQKEAASAPAPASAPAAAWYPAPSVEPPLQPSSLPPAPEAQSAPPFPLPPSSNVPFNPPPSRPPPRWSHRLPIKGTFRRSEFGGCSLWCICWSSWRTLHRLWRICDLAQLQTAAAAP